ncbi:predicted protein [Uncinocarpus reesii 1704]|uniref:Uncharacterized protein n=1 Tax=Uncinocarpus reesii (strain UAMH 1704) TaxID=336963 RepID=C4JS75_UNCRE|nr:uncharacterized protein UREG_05314 [Uncinocarpus reesii 1704]EEP80472.1 predicted protein [Uncinocarpus reesii 1704]
MAYNAVSQNEIDAASDSDASEPSPLPKTSFEPLSIDFENLGGSSFMSAAKTEKPSSISLKSVIRSRGASTTSYDMLEDDDYQVVGRASKSERDCHVKTAQGDGPADLSKPPPLNTPSSSPEPSEPILQSPKTDGPALCHPTPDLQSLQGAYVGNVERLEKTAERLSLALERGDDLEGIESRRNIPALGSPAGSISSGPRKPSIGSRTGPILGSSGIYSPGGHISSPRRSVQSSPSSQAAARLRSGSVASRLARVVEPENEDQLNNPEQISSVPASIPPPPNPHSLQLQSHPLQHHEENMGVPIDEEQMHRPGSAGSTDTYQQATNLFKDFDGVHFTAHSSEKSQSRRVSISRPPLASLPQAHKEPPPGENMVYYPAPVPMVLNLPQRLSKQHAASEQEKRRTQLMNSMPIDKRKSAVWLPNNEKEGEPPARQSKRLSQMPPQLRASAFFDQPPSHLDITVRDNSAVATLDCILDAAASAPVSAFTDHPIVGHIGAEVYGKEKTKKKNKIEKKRFSENPLGVGEATHNRNPSGQSESHAEGKPGPDEATPFRNSYERDADDSDHFIHPQGQQQDDSESDSDDSKDEEAFVGPPTTLLAELQMRKQEQKQRNRTAATAFPNGMHSTLLELDAVAQRQRENRNQKHVILAWEDPDLADRREPDDDDVPLALLFPEKTKQNDNRPLGLMEKLELEENEPLSRRRARIRGEPPPAPRPPPVPVGYSQPPAKRASTAYTLDIPGLEDGESDEEETLAQRVRRLRAREEKAGSDFASELLSRFGDDKPPEKPASEDGGEPEEETLGQRRKRLQAEAQAGNPNAPDKLSSRRSLADVLQAHPVGPQSQVHVHPAGLGAAGSRQSLVATNRLSRVSTNGPLLQFGNEMNGGMGPYNAHGLIAPAYGNGLSAVNLNPHFYAQPSYRPSLQPGPVIDQKQRDMIDRWRLGVQ